MKYLTKLTVCLITIALVGSSKSWSEIDIKLPLDFLKTNQTYAARPPDTPLNESALTRLSKQIAIEIVTQSFLRRGKKYISLGSGVIIAKSNSNYYYYVLTANHISDSDDRMVAFIRDEKPGEIGEILPLKVIKRYPREDLAVLMFASDKNYQVAELGELSNNRQVYVTGWPSNEDRGGFQFTPARVTNRRRGDNLTYEPTEPGEDVYKGMSGGAVLNEDGQVVGIHRGLVEVGGDGEGVLISTFLEMAPPEVVSALLRPNTISYATRISEVRAFAGSHLGRICLEDCIAISPDGRTVVSGSFNNSIEVWNLATGSLKATLTDHRSSVFSVAISPHGRTVVSGSNDKTIKVWDLATGNLKATLTGHRSSVNSVAISPDGRTIVSGSNTIKVWDLATGNLKATLTGHRSSVYSLAISPDGRTVVSGSLDNTIKVWDLATGSLKATLIRYSGMVNSVAISPDGGTVVSGGIDRTIKVWDLVTGSLKATLTGHTSGVSSVAISPDGRTVVSGSLDNTIKVWDLATGSLKATLIDHSSSVYSLAISPDGRTIVSGDRDGNIKVWSVP